MELPSEYLAGYTPGRGINVDRQYKQLSTALGTRNDLRTRLTNPSDSVAAVTVQLKRNFDVRCCSAEQPRSSALDFFAEVRHCEKTE